MSTDEVVTDAVDDEVAEVLVPRHDSAASRPGQRSGFVLIDGRQVRYLSGVSGAGTAGAVPARRRADRLHVREARRRARRRCHVLAPDLPNHGDSDSMTDGFGPKSLAEAMPPLLDAFGMRRVSLVGASLGGLTSLRLAEACPDRVVSISLIDVGHQREPEVCARSSTSCRRTEVVRLAGGGGRGDLGLPAAAAQRAPRVAHAACASVTTAGGCGSTASAVGSARSPRRSTRPTTSTSSSAGWKRGGPRR
ncbi:MAG: alpha/beta fold hydrolase [Acidimicrobiales bacterium]